MPNLPRKNNPFVSATPCRAAVQRPAGGFSFGLLLVAALGWPLLAPDCAEAWGKKDKDKKKTTITAKRALALAQKHYAKGVSLREKGKNSLAVEELKKALIADPSSVEACLELGDLYTELQVHDRAVELLDSGILMGTDQDIGPEALGKAFCNLATNLLALDQLERAQAVAASATLILPQTPTPWELLGTAQHRRELHNEAIVSLREAVKQGGDSSDLWWKAGTIGIALKDARLTEEALVQLQKIDALRASDFTLLLEKSGMKMPPRRIASPSTPVAVSPAVASSPSPAPRVTPPRPPVKAVATPTRLMDDTEVAIPLPTKIPPRIGPPKTATPSTPMKVRTPKTASEPAPVSVEPPKPVIDEGHPDKTPLPTLEDDPYAVDTPETPPTESVEPDQPAPETDLSAEPGTGGEDDPVIEEESGSGPEAPVEGEEGEEGGEGESGEMAPEGPSAGESESDHSAPGSADEDTE